MLNIPSPLLGEVTAITIATPDLERSLAFYQLLGYKEIWRYDVPFPWIQITDGVLLIMLRQDKTPALSLTYYVKNLDAVVAFVEEKGYVFIQKPNANDMVKRYVFKSPDNLNIALVTHMEGFNQPAGPGMLAMAPQDYFNPDKYVNKTAGLFGELAHPVKDLDTSIAFWNALGFNTLSKNSAPYPWAIMSDGLSIVGLHQTTNFDYPVITYFASDMKDKIEKLKPGGLNDYTLKGTEPNITVTTPEGQHVNLFKL